MINNSLFTSERQTWDTPRHIFDHLDKIFNFDLDPCCEPHTAKCGKYYTKEDDGLIQDWSGCNVFINPPYETKLQRAFVEKAASDEPNKAVCLIPARTDTKIWHEVIFPKASQIWFIKGRIKFEGADNSAPFPSAVVVFGDWLPNKKQYICSYEF